MTLIVFLLAYGVRRRLDALDRWSGDRLWRQWFQQACKMEAGHEVGLGAGLALVALPALLIGGAVLVLGEAGWRVAAYPLECVVLILMMGVPGWHTQLKSYAGAWRRGDMQSAWRHIQSRLPAEDRGSALSPDAMHLSLCRALVLAIFRRFFLVAFWYLVGGVGLAILARGLVALAEQWPHAAVRPGFTRLVEWISWLPVRLLSLTFGIAGDLAGWLGSIREALIGLGKNSRQILMISANGSLTGYALDPGRFAEIHPGGWPDFGERSLEAVRGLLNRSMLVWICLMALLVIAGVV